jgi:hypothetical protein
VRIFDIFTGQAAQNAANAEIAGSRQSYGLLSRVQPNADTAKFSLFRPSFSQRVAARDAAAVVPFVALSSKQRRISSLSVATGAARHAALFGPSPGGFWPPPPTTENPQAVSAARKSVWPNILRYVVINTMLRSAAQALKRRHMPSPDAPDALTVTDGAVTVGFITESGAKHFAFDAAGTLIGEYKTRVEAVRAIPNLIKQASAILKRAM